MPYEEGCSIEEEEGGHGDESGVAEIGAAGEWLWGLGRVVRQVANLPTGEADGG